MIRKKNHSMATTGYIEVVYNFNLNSVTTRVPGFELTSIVTRSLATPDRVP